MCSGCACASCVPCSLNFGGVYSLVVSRWVAPFVWHLLLHVVHANEQDEKTRYVTEAPAASANTCFALVGAYILSGLPYLFATVPWCAFVASGLFWGSSFFSGLYISAMALPLQWPLALTLLSSGLFFGFAPNFVGCLLLERHSVDSGESLRWMFAQLWNSALLVWKMFALFFLCVWSLQGLQGIGYSGAGWSPGDSALFAWGMKTVFIEPLKTVLVSGVRPEDHCFCMSSHTTDGSFL